MAVQLAYLKVTDPAGVYLPRHGSRPAGGVFEMPAEAAADYLATYPDQFSGATAEDYAAYLESLRPARSESPRKPKPKARGRKER
ncbi:MAG TPA: hypothetical protein VJG32_18000 [Anaerolineae bacterium]|nr:hypothetical protein [Anaerolineae bacterium]